MAKLGVRIVPVNETAARIVLKKWVDLLGLKEWNIIFDWKADPKNTKTEIVSVCTTYNASSHNAHIEITDYELYERMFADAQMFNYDYEQVLVQGLLDLKFSVIDGSNDKTKNQDVYTLIESLAESLVRASRYLELKGAVG